MKNVYVVLVGYDYEGENIRGIFKDEDEAEELRQKFIRERTGDYVNCEEWPVIGS